MSTKIFANAYIFLSFSLIPKRKKNTYAHRHEKSILFESQTRRLSNSHMSILLISVQQKLLSPDLFFLIAFHISLANKIVFDCSFDYKIKKKKKA